MNRSLTLAAAALGVPLAGLAFALVLGVGVVRQGTALAVSAGAVALVFLPALGLGLLAGRRQLALWSALALWSGTLLVGFPLYFPGERGHALAAGGGILASVLGLSPEPAWAVQVDALLPGLDGVRMTPASAPPPVVIPPPARSRDTGQAPPLPLDGTDEVVLPYEGVGRTLTVPVTLEGRDGAVVDVQMVFDTGATLTTVDADTLRALGVRLADDAPEIPVRTANGERLARVALLDRVWLGGIEVPKVSVSVCEDCAGEDSVGLLGLNVSGRFLVTVDQSRRELVLQPRSDEHDRSLDVGPWLDISATATRWEDGRVEVEARAQNHAPYLVSLAAIAIRCSDSYEARLVDIPPRGEASTLVSLPLGADCGTYTVALDRASW